MAEIQNQGDLKLQRKVGLLSGIGLIIGNIIGSGIFISPGGVLERSGSVGLALIVWSGSGLLSIFCALSYAELGTLIPKSGGEYSYFMDGLGSLHPFWGPLPAFLYSWVSVLLMSPASIAVGCLSCADYTVYPLLTSIGSCPVDVEMLVKLVALVYLGIIIALNSSSVAWTIRVTNVFTLAKLAAIASMIGCGIYQLSTGNTNQSLTRGFEGSTTDISTIALAFYSGLWSYSGWNALNFVTEEVKNPNVTLPRAIVIGITSVTCCYLAVNVAYLAVLTPETIIQSEAVAVDVANAMLGPFAFIIPLSVAMSTFSGVLSSAFVTSRICFASAREGHMIDFLSFVHIENQTPFPALLFTGFMSFLMIINNSVMTLIDFFSFTVWIFIDLIMILVLILRHTRPNDYRPYRVPLVIPVVTAMIGLFIVVAPLVSDPAVEYLYVLIVLSIGFLVYIPFVFYKYSLNLVGPATRFIQLILNAAPTSKTSFKE